MTIYLDPRAGSGDLLGDISPSPTLCQLDSADVMFPGNGPRGAELHGVEVKKLGDALQCMADGRLVTQVRKMHDDYDVCWFILEADIRPGSTGLLQTRLRKRNPKTGRHSEFWADAVFGNRQRMTYAMFIEWLVMSIGFAADVRVLRTVNRQETGALVSAMYRWTQKPWDAHKSLRVFDTSQRPQLIEPSIPAEIAHDLAEGVGWEKAMAVAEHFGSARRMASATQDEYLKIRGIGKELAKRLHDGWDVEHVTRRRKAMKQQQKRKG